MARPAGNMLCRGSFEMEINDGCCKLEPHTAEAARMKERPTIINHVLESRFRFKARHNEVLSFTIAWNVLIVISVTY
jgi:hypothetical protein